ncbi:phytanoyl-CoA dioxygenase family protein [Streptomyces jeddahensis]|uniref:Phytanoyl-CoA dioxygenase (PhyH) n=1 Tax=Streptomyces jeddahensis TaxID=1716141 RepID=A0A177HQ23_9ACTN|nr:phytanoyl-CoA dioxygenase family protein [Streptomyces jeddahensis]OAH12993.1 phytanoyl-CoA dioxygenase (PhyH) [Streptomyces jeddahensis]
MAVFSLTPAEQALLPSPEEVRFYRDHGWYLSKRLFSDEEIEEVSRSNERFYEGHRDRTLPKKPPREEYWEPEHGDVLRHNDYICYENLTVRRILCKPLIAAVAGRLMGTEQVRLWTSTLIYKPPQPEEPTNVVPWHTDRHHWQMCTSDKLLTAFIPLHDCDEDSGTLSVIDSSHTWEDVDLPDSSALHFAQRDADELDDLLEATATRNGSRARAVPLAIEKGQVSFHHCRTYHGSGPNVSGRPRRVVTIRFQDQSNRWRPFRLSDGSLATHNIDELVRRTPEGHPDYADPDFCPVLYEDTPRTRRSP